jgi:hypothetical protein
VITSAEEFVALRSSTEQANYSRAANEFAPEDVLLEVIARYLEMRSWVAHNKTVPLNILRLLARDPDPQVRWRVAQKCKADLSLLMDLACDPDPSVRQRVAFNRSAPLSVLEMLERDDAPLVANAPGSASLTPPDLSLMGTVSGSLAVMAVSMEKLPVAVKVVPTE